MKWTAPCEMSQTRTAEISSLTQRHRTSRLKICHPSLKRLLAHAGPSQIIPGYSLASGFGNDLVRVQPISL